MARPAPAADRVVQILDLLVTHPTERFTLTELVRRTGMSLGSAHAVLAVLEGSGHVTRHPVTKAYSLGPALVVAGVVALEHHPGIAAAREAIGPLADELGVEVVVTARTIDEIVFVAHAGTHTPYGPAIREGERVPLVPPLGGVFLAWSDDGEIDHWLSRSPDLSDTALERNRTALELARARGFSVTTSTDTQRLLGERTYSLADDPTRADLHADVDELFARLATEDYPLVDLDTKPADEIRYDIGIVAAPVFGPDGGVIAAISATGFPPGLDADTVLSIGARVRDTAAMITRASRGRVPPS